MQKKIIFFINTILIVSILINGYNNDAFSKISTQHKYALGYQMGCTDGPDQENYIFTGGIHKHSKEFTKGYNQSFFHGCNHDDPALQAEIDTIIKNHTTE